MEGYGRVWKGMEVLGNWESVDWVWERGKGEGHRRQPAPTSVKGSKCVRYAGSVGLGAGDRLWCHNARHTDLPTLTSPHRLSAPTGPHTAGACQPARRDARREAAGAPAAAGAHAGVEVWRCGPRVRGPGAYTPLPVLCATDRRRPSLPLNCHAPARLLG
eukprot:352367-Chlamydomonas_euryale.AAC.2